MSNMVLNIEVIPLGFRMTMIAEHFDWYAENLLKI